MNIRNLISIVLITVTLCLGIASAQTIALTGNIHGTCTPTTSRLQQDGSNLKIVPVNGVDGFGGAKNPPQDGYLLLQVSGLAMNQLSYDADENIQMGTPAIVEMCGGLPTMYSIAPFESNGAMPFGFLDRNGTHWSADPLQYTQGGAPVVGDGTLQNIVLTMQLPSNMSVKLHVYVRQSDTAQPVEVFVTDEIKNMFNPEAPSESKFVTYTQETQGVPVVDGNRVFFLLEYHTFPDSNGAYNVDLPYNVDAYVAKN